MAGTPVDYNAIAPNFSSVKDQIEQYGGGGDIEELEERIDDVYFPFFDIFETFREDKTYSKDDFVIYRNSLYRFKTSHSAGPWIFDDAERMTFSTFFSSFLRSKFLEPYKNLGASTFDEEWTYHEGDLVAYGSAAIYKCVVAEHTGPWNYSHFTRQYLATTDAS